MTNREWLNSLSNEDFIYWLFEKSYFDENFKPINQVRPTFKDIKNNYLDSKQGLLEWLDEEHYNIA